VPSEKGGENGLVQRSRQQREGKDQAFNMERGTEDFLTNPLKGGRRRHEGGKGRICGYGGPIKERGNPLSDRWHATFKEKKREAPPELKWLGGGDVVYSPRKSSADRDMGGRTDGTKRERHFGRGKIQHGGNVLHNLNSESVREKTSAAKGGADDTHLSYAGKKSPF